MAEPCTAHAEDKWLEAAGPRHAARPGPDRGRNVHHCR